MDTDTVGSSVGRGVDMDKLEVTGRRVMMPRPIFRKGTVVYAANRGEEKRLPSRTGKVVDMHWQWHSPQRNGWVYIVSFSEGYSLEYAEPSIETVGAKHFVRKW